MKFQKNLTIALIMLLITACGDKSDDVTKVGATSNMIAKVDGVMISQEEFAAYLSHKNIPKQKADADNSKYLDHYLERQALSSAIEKTSLLDASEVAVAVKEFKHQLLIGRYFEKYLKESVSEQAMRNYYTSNPELYQNEKAEVAHILIRTNNKMSEAERKSLRTKADEAYSKVIMGLPFDEIVTTYSDDKVSAKNGGNLGWIKKGSIAPAFSTTVFAMKDGDISLPFETAYGFHIVKILQAPTIVKQPFEIVKGDIRYLLRGEAKQAEKQRLLDSVKIEKSNGE